MYLHSIHHSSDSQEVADPPRPPLNSFYSHPLHVAAQTLLELFDVFRLGG